MMTDIKLAALHYGHGFAIVLALGAFMVAIVGSLSGAILPTIWGGLFGIAFRALGRGLDNMYSAINRK